MATKTIEHQGLSWIHIDQVDDAVVADLKKTYQFHHLDLEDIQSESQTPKVDIYKQYLFIVLQFPHWDPIADKVVDLEVDMFIGENYLITIQHHKNKELKNLFYRCMKHAALRKDWMGHGSGYLLYRITEALFHTSRPILNNLGKNISDLENRIFDDTPDYHTVRELAIHRRNVLHFRRIIDPQRYLMSNLSHVRKPFLDETMSLYFDDLSDYLSKFWAIITTYRDTIDGLHVTVESLLTQRTNKVIGALTVISVALLPLTLLSGIYGMNIPLPYQESPLVIFLMFGLLTTIILSSIAMMRHKRLL